MEKVFLFLALTSLATSAIAFEGDDRMNVMECSHQEVVAYMELPDPERRAMNDYFKWQTAFKSTEVIKSESDPANCVAVLYGDISIMAEKLKLSTQALLAMQLPSMSTLTQLAMDQLTSSICGRIAEAETVVVDGVISGYEDARKIAQRDLTRKYGQRAMESYVTDAIIPPKYQSQGLQYKNGEIDVNAFRKSTRRRWLRELDELKD
jgi:hypothetical protein